jgi:hypothetical protein
MQDRQKAQLAAALVAAFGLTAGAAHAQTANNSVSVSEKQGITQQFLGSKKEKGKEGSCKGKEGSCKGKEGSCKGKDSEKGKEGSCKGKEGSCKGKEGSCKGKEESK